MTVVIGIDPHKSSHTAAALDPDSHAVLDTVRVDATLVEYRRLLGWAKRFGQHRWAVENARGLGRHLAQWLVARGETVVDVPSTATARVRELSRGGRRKNDALDAAAAASVAALHGDAVPVPAENASTVLGMLDERRLNLTQQRTRTVNQLHALLRELLPDGAPTDLTASQAAALLARIRPASAAERARKDLARDLVADIRMLDDRLKDNKHCAASKGDYPTSSTKQFVRDTKRATAASPGGHLGATLTSSATDPTPTIDALDKSHPGPTTNDPTPRAAILLT